MNDTQLSVKAAEYIPLHKRNKNNESQEVIEQLKYQHQKILEQQRTQYKNNITEKKTENQELQKIIDELRREKEEQQIIIEKLNNKYSNIDIVKDERSLDLAPSFFLCYRGIWASSNIFEQLKKNIEEKDTILKIGFENDSPLMKYIDNIYIQEIDFNSIEFMYYQLTKECNRHYCFDLLYIYEYNSKELKNNEKIKEYMLKLLNQDLSIKGKYKFSIDVTILDKIIIEVEFYEY